MIAWETILGVDFSAFWHESHHFRAYGKQNRSSYRRRTRVSTSLHLFTVRKCDTHAVPVDGDDSVAEDVRSYFGQKVYQTTIPRNVRISEAPSYGKPVLLYDWRCAGSQAYIHLASEMLYREQDYAQ